MIILGIDPALTCLGWGVIKSDAFKIEYVSSGLIKTKSKEFMPDRLAFITSAIEEVIDTYKPDAVAMEETFVNRNAMCVAEHRPASDWHCLRPTFSAAEDGCPDL